MKVTQPRQVTNNPTGLTAHRVVRLFGIAFLATALLLTIFVVIQPAAMQRAVARLEADWGARLYAFDEGLAEGFSAALGKFFQGTMQGIPEIPNLVIDVPFEGMQQIYGKREEALARGSLVQGSDDFVNAEIRFDTDIVPIRMRLKGDWNDHLLGKKWSFRIHTRRGSQILGMRRLSIQNPNTRGFQSEVLFFETLKRYGVLTPRYQFANTTLNGESLGIMAVEEFFAKELLEHRGRKESVIIRFDESLVWSARDSLSGEPVGFAGAFDHYRNAAIDAFGSGDIAESEALTQQYEIAAALLRGFVERTLSASEVFDIRQLGRFIAVADAFGAWHTLSWHNLRFYFNPITMRLEPIAFDASMQNRFPVGRSVVNHDPFVLDVMADAEVFAEYQRTIDQLIIDVRDGGLIEFLREIEAPILALLRTEFRTLGPWPLEELVYRLGFLDEQLNASNAAQLFSFLDKPHESRLYPTLLHAQISTDSTANTLELRNAVPWPLEVNAIYWTDELGQQISAVVDPGPLTLAARGIGTLPIATTVNVSPPPAETGWQLFVAAKIPQRTWYQNIPVRAAVKAAESAGLPAANLEEFLLEYPFLQINTDSKTARLPAGQWEIDKSLFLPRGYSLQIDAGAHLRLGANTVIMVRGPVQFTGTANAPIVLEARDESGWPGIAVLEADTPSRISHTNIADIRGVRSGAWSLTGGIVFYESDVTIEHSRISNSLGEDALNIVHSDFLLDDVHIVTAASDAFDADFATGTVSNSRFSAILGDAIDISGSQITVTDVRFENVADKALSVGEGSDMIADGVAIENVGSGAAVKDGSSLQLNRSSVNGARFAALTAYIKKQEYGPAQIQATDITITDTGRPAIVQNRSVVELNGERMPTEDIDVDALYATVMLPSIAK